MIFSQNLNRYVTEAPTDMAGHTVGEVLASAFQANPALRRALLDESGAVRFHIAIFVDGQQITDRSGLSDRVDPTAEVLVMQALAGG